MTDYRISKKNNTEVKGSRLNKWQGIFAFFIVSFLVLVLFGGVLKSILAKKDAAHAVSWDGVSSFVLGLSDNQNSLFIFQKDPKRAVFVKTGLLGSGLSEDLLSKTASVVFGTDVKNFINAGNLSDVEIKKKFENFISLTTPLKILTTGWASGSMSTNVSRMDALGLWWQLKAIRSKDLQFINLTTFLGSEPGKSDDKILGITSDVINRGILEYLENTKIIQEDIDLKIVNSSDDDRSSNLAENFITVVGGRVVSVSGDTSIGSKCNITTNVKSSYTARYLAKVFICDINDAPQMDDKPSLTIYLGQDFPARYFK